MFLLHEHAWVEGRTAQLVQFKRGFSVPPYYKVSLFVSVEGESAALVPGQV